MTEPDTELDSVDSYDELISIVDVDDVVLYEIHAKDKAGFPATEFDELKDGRAYSEVRTQSTGFPSYWNISLTVETEQIGCRARVEVTTDDAKYVVDGAIFYSLSRAVQIPQELLTRFVQQVAFFGIYPYMREALQTSAIRLRNEPPLLPLIQSGNLRMRAEEVRPAGPNPDVE